MSISPYSRLPLAEIPSPSPLSKPYEITLPPATQLSEGSGSSILVKSVDIGFY